MSEKIVVAEAAEDTARRISVIAEITEDGGTKEEWKFVERFTATAGNYNYQINDELKDSDPYWLICGDNTGSQQLVVWPYMIDPLITLLQKLKEVG